MTHEEIISAFEAQLRSRILAGDETSAAAAVDVVTDYVAGQLDLEWNEDDQTEMLPQWIMRDAPFVSCALIGWARAVQSSKLK